MRREPGSWRDPGHGQHSRQTASYPRRGPRGAAAGFLLVEVVVAVALLALLVAPLAGALQSAVDRARGVRDQPASPLSPFSGEVSLPALEDEAPPAWRWGAQVLSAKWGPGPTLGLLCTGNGVGGAAAGTSLRVGIWLNGWFQGEETATEGSVLHIAREDWGARVGSELVVRVRAQDGVWGPPWRTVLPGSDGELARELSAVKPSVTSAPLDGRESLVHLPALGNPRVSASAGVAQLERDAAGAVLILRSVAQGRADLALGELTQSWLARGGRWLDVYF